MKPDTCPKCGRPLVFVDEPVILAKGTPAERKVLRLQAACPSCGVVTAIGGVLCAGQVIQGLASGDVGHALRGALGLFALSLMNDDAAKKRRRRRRRRIRRQIKRRAQNPRGRSNAQKNAKALKTTKKSK